MFYEASFVFLYPGTLARGYKSRKFCKKLFEMKIHFRSFLSHDISKNINI